MKKIVLALIVALLGSIVMNAQPASRHGMSPEQMVEKRIERLDKALDLTDQQKAEIAKIYLEEMKAMRHERPSKASKDEETQIGQKKMDLKQMQAQREATDSRIASLLTAEQASKFAELKSRDGMRRNAKNFKGLPHKAEKDPARRDCKCGCSCKNENEKH